MIRRTHYLEQLNQWRDKEVIKVVTGIRRCGKSTLLQQFQEELLVQGIDEAHIIYLNLEDLQNEPLLDYHALYNEILTRIDGNGIYYVFLDEIQMVKDFQKAIDSLALKKNVDIYITGSNAYLLSGELATLLSGRYVEINMLPFSFREYSEMKGTSGEDAFADYLRWGGMPYIASQEDPQTMADVYLEGIYNTIVVKDVELRMQRREADPNSRRVSDLSLLKNVARYLADAIGNPISVSKIAGFIASTGRKVSQTTISDYVESLVEPYIFYPVQRFDVLGKQLLKTSGKYYITDLGLRRHMVAKSNYDLGLSLENVVYFELLRRGYTVNVGKWKELEVDFVARKGEARIYVQVTASMTDPSTFEREMRPLREIPDNYPKIVLTLDRFSDGDYEGILVRNAIDWLLEE
ncbi:MAG: ATP-binding protein [Firmicutes bacterium]|nr:ATP-binding protein [Bacillota bacterium]MBQ6295632.1 ATP-binding protein [Bacillota bacterium]